MIYSQTALPKARWRGRECDSYSEWGVRALIEAAGLAGRLIYHQPLLSRPDGSSFRVPDWVAWCGCPDHHAIALEFCGALASKPYRQNWGYKRGPWFEAQEKKLRAA